MNSESPFVWQVDFYYGAKVYRLGWSKEKDLLVQGWRRIYSRLWFSDIDPWRGPNVSNR